MAMAQWMRVLDTLGGLVQVAARFRRQGSEEPAGLQTVASGGPLGQLETRLAGVVVAALKEAFDRDSARLELERSHIEAERRRAEEALRAELRRLGARFLEKPISKEDLRAFVRHVYRWWNSRPRPPHSVDEWLSEWLTPAQRRIVELAMTGVSQPGIAATLDCSLRTVHSHVGAILEAAEAAGGRA